MKPLSTIAELNPAFLELQSYIDRFNSLPDTEAAKSGLQTLTIRELADKFSNVGQLGVDNATRSQTMVPPTPDRKSKAERRASTSSISAIILKQGELTEKEKLPTRGQSSLPATPALGKKTGSRPTAT
ncbi:hypothetical protein QVD17_19929 [Tagetes erecta]|uniref:Uncharacterized protein n=1 Tax=Tagetes erecta TaxID=13708 RepID=A0AAD8KNM1_TARER|nr:hypothetical protein QVD17_19929 [Tagetes erecta]